MQTADVLAESIAMIVVMILMVGQFINLAEADQNLFSIFLVAGSAYFKSTYADNMASWI
jgi:hypothetical protein